MDIIIRGGTVIDGTGQPGFAADVGLKDGKIQAIGVINETAAEEIDARGKIVIPGFVDIHTHYDGQATWDSHIAPSSWHGVTTVLMGNCAVGFAPCKAEDRERLIELMEGVEDIPRAAMHEGLDWTWRTFPEFLDRLDRTPHDIDIAALLPHAALRVYVMGERATHKEKATPEDIQRMREIAREAMQAGAFGFSTSRHMSHRTLAGEYIPTLRAAEEELTAIATGVQEAGAGLFEFISDWDCPSAKAEFELIKRIVEQTRVPVLFSMPQRHSRVGDFDELLALSDRTAAEGLPIRPVIAPRPVGVLLGLQGSQNPFSGCPSYKAIAHLPFAERAKAMSDPELRARILSEDPLKENTFPLAEQLKYHWMFPFGEPIDYEPTPAKSLEAIAAREGRTAPEVAYDFLISDEGRNFLLAPISNYANVNLDFFGEALRHPNTLLGLGDGGAHVGFVCDASFTTFLLTHWGRDRKDGRFPLTELVRRQTSDTADAMGLHDRGRIGVGKKADINVIDFDKLKLLRPYIVNDLPAGGKRLMQKAEGYVATIKSGVVIARNGEPTGALPGVILRGGPVLDIS
ncbi:amidohydrolase family protein [soil metagenome]